jgi:4-carboxymuconolactone decarboxylase
VPHTNDTPRFPPLTHEQMSEEQKTLLQNYASWGRLSTPAAAAGKVQGGLNIMIRSPELAARLSKVMEYFRKGTALPPRLNEFAILIVSRVWSSQYQWQSHHALAIKAGLSEATVEDLAHGKRPSRMQDDEALVYDFLMELQRKHSVSDELFDKAKATFGERQLVDLVGVCGYYTLAAQMHRIADVKAIDPSKPTLPTLPEKD